MVRLTWGSHVCCIETSSLDTLYKKLYWITVIRKMTFFSLISDFYIHSGCILIMIIAVTLYLHSYVTTRSNFGLSKKIKSIDYVWALWQTCIKSGQDCGNKQFLCSSIRDYFLVLLVNNLDLKISKFEIFYWAFATPLYDSYLGINYNFAKNA